MRRITKGKRATRKTRPARAKKPSAPAPDLAHQVQADSEALFQTLFENLNDAVLVADAQTRKFVIANKRAVDWLGYSLQELCGMSVEDIHPPEDLPEVIGQFERQAKGEIQIAPKLPVLRKDGGVFYCDINSSPFLLSGKRYLMGIFRDVTERRLAEEALAETRARHRAVCDQSEDGILMLHPENGRIVYANPAFQKLCGRPAQELYRMHIWEIRPRKQRAQAKAMFLKIVKSGNGGSAEIPLERPDGTLIHIEFKANRIKIGGKEFILSFARDISDRLMARIALIASESKYREFFNLLPVGAAVWEPVDGGADFRIVELNPAGEKLSRVRLEDIRGKLAREAFPGIEDFGLLQVLRRVNKTGAPEHHPVSLYKDGSLESWFDNLVFKLPDGRVIAVYENVTERRKTEQRLVESEEKHRRLIENLNTGFLFYSHGTDGVFTYLSPSVKTVLGYSEPEFLKHFTEFLADDETREICVRHTEGSIRGENQPPYQFRIRHKDGTLRWLEVNEVPVKDQAGMVIAVEGIAQDITSRKEHEKSLALLAGIVEQGTGVVVITDTKGVIEFVNPAFVKVSGFQPREVIGRPASGLGTGQPEEEDALWKALNAGRTWDGVWKNQAKDGSSYWLRATIFPVREEAGKALRFAMIAHDITRQVETDEKLKASQAQFQQSQKLEAVGRLAGGVAHDFNNLVTVIRGCADFLDKATPDGDSRKDDIKEIALAGARAADLTRQLLAFSRKQVLQPRTVAVNAVVSGMESLLKRTLGEDIRLRTSLDPASEPVFIDPGQLEQVLLNLAVNARAAMPRGGTLALKTATLELKEEQVWDKDVLPPGRYTVLSVKDDGCGMDEDTLKRAFEPFFTTKPVGQGSGLGLSTAYGIITQSGGLMSAQSTPGEGTAFAIYLPVTGKAAGISKEASAPGLIPASGTVLLVEDDDTVRKIAARTLRGAGFHILEANGGPQAMDILRSIDAPVDLLLTDVVMPGMDGRELSEKLRALRPALKVLFTSGYTGDALSDRGILEESEDFLAKPFTPSALLDRVRALISKKLPS